MTIFTRFFENVDRRPDADAVIYISNGQNYRLCWQEVLQYCNSYARGLKALGVTKGSRVYIYSDTNKEWGFLDLAIMSLGGVTVPIYHSAHTDDIDFILSHSKGETIFVQNLALLQRLKSCPSSKNLKKIVLLQETTEVDGPITTLRNFCETSEILNIREVAKNISLDDDATIIYTSGTSGTPKGVLLTHRQVLSCVSEVFPLLGLTHLDRTLTFLPFSHVLGRAELWGSYFTGYTLGYAESIEKIKKNLLQIQPTVLVGVPRIFEKIYYGIQNQLNISRLRLAMFNQALNVGKKVAEHRKNKKSPPLSLAVRYQVAKKLVLGTILEKLGGRLRFAVSGGAPLDPEIANFFEACGMTVLEGYGLTETTGPVFVNTLFDYRVGTVGRAIGEVVVKFDADGEILIKSDKVMKEYFGNGEETASVFTEDGFLRTGDIGQMDKDGFLAITDRKKDLIKTAGGKFVAPQKLQNLFATSPLIGHVHIHGDKKKYIVALITLEKDGLFSLKKKLDIRESNYENLVRHPKVEKEIRKAVSQVNQQLAGFETIKRYQVLDHEFSIEGGQLTPSLKVKRKKIDEIYSEHINSLYN